MHEQILPALRRVNVPVRGTEVTGRYTGYTDPALREQKPQRDCKILEAEPAERPGDPFVLFNLGAIAVERQDWSTTLGQLQRSPRGSGLTYSCGEWRADSGQWPVNLEEMVSGEWSGGSGGWSSTPARATSRPWRAGKQRSESRSLPPASVSPTPSASAREVSRNTANPAPTNRGQGSAGTNRPDCMIFQVRRLLRAFMIEGLDAMACLPS